MDERPVLTFDICSSTSILEDLHRTNTIEKYAILLDDIMTFLKTNSTRYGYEIYKFLGDGFILIFEDSTPIDTILEFCVALTYDCNTYIEEFIRRYIEVENGILRKGITIGIDKGYVSKLTINEKDEYVGRPINVSVRLQSSLYKKEHANRVLMSLKLYRDIMEPRFKKLCAETSRTFKNIANNEKVKCYELNILYYLSKDEAILRPLIKKEINKKDMHSSLEQFSRLLQKYATAASTTNISILFKKDQKKEKQPEKTNNTLAL